MSTQGGFNAPLRRVGVVTLVLFGMLFVNLNYVQGVKAKDYRTSDYNARVQTAEYDVERGKIIVGDTAVAESKETTDSLKYLRTYPGGEMYAHVVGFRGVNIGSSGVEKLEDEYLSGNSDAQFADRISEMFTGQKPGGNVVLSLSKGAQETAWKELTGQKLSKTGAAVAIDPRTGAILAAVSFPSYDPGPYASHDTKVAVDAKTKVESDKELKPSLNRAFSDRFPPGSTFKVITSAAALANGATPETVMQAGNNYQPPQTSNFSIKNSSQNTCPEPSITLKQALTVSCNTSFARYAVESLGPDKLKEMGRNFGFEEIPHIERDDKNFAFGVAKSEMGTMSGPDGKVDPPALAQSAIGQREVKMTPLQGAMIAATVANNGSQMRPYLVQELKTYDLTTTHFTAQPKELRRSCTPAISRDLQDMMVNVVENGTGKKARINGFKVGGKTGTADGAEEEGAHGWFIGFVMKDDKPIIATAVFLQNAGKGGSGEAARISGEIMKSYIAEKGLS
ncbi:cell division protein FtsI [Virgisporangium aliadipatigenens]|uniref:Cell division protein FtsI n=1 Tax=Virgisporangium aliadipatigenens TaxID=741659 RepID=A0A8J4DRM3_9ACTN|nr:penicillin-binding protein 2 [Virgisporangium aliadipatigenens]GIJ47216.1 cell division protein FtsI [Virgisporangium aliadipatigenens]